MIKRIPIKVKRTPIKLPPHIKMQLKLWEIQEITREDDIYELSQHYNMLVMEVSKKAGYNSLSLKNYTEHKNWIHFESVYEICRMKGWDAKLYLEGQFERARGWTKMKYPLPNMLYGDKALWFHMNYISTIIQKYEQDTQGAKKEKGKETKTLRTQIVDGVISSVEYLADHLQKSPIEDKGQLKAITIFNHWHYLSPFYLWSIPWFHDITNDISGKNMDDCKAEFNRIRKSPSMQRTIADTVLEIEKHFNIPGNVKL